MSTRLIQKPIHRVYCDRPECDAKYAPDDNWHQSRAHLARIAAGKAGWDVPPVRGKGSRRPTDFCPEHRTKPVEVPDHVHP